MSDAGSRPSSGNAGIKTIPLDPGHCRNITIHGYCKWADKGCRFNHGENRVAEARLRPDTATFTPTASLGNSTSTGPGSIGPGAPVFVPRGANSSPAKLTNRDPTRAQASFSSPIKTSSGLVSASMNKPSPQSLPFVPLDNPSMRATTISTPSGYSSPSLNPYDQSTNDMFFQSRTMFQPLQHHLYCSLPPNRKTLGPNERSIHDFFMNETLRETLQKKQAAAIQIIPNSNLPPYLHSYHSLVPLDVQAERSDRVFGWPSWVYKAFNKQDGCTYALRRIEGFKLINESSIGLVERWRKLVCANVVHVKEAFTSKSFADDSIIFVHEYHPMSTTLYDLHYSRSNRKFSTNAIVGEKLIWSYLTQLTNALRAIHALGLACRILDPTKILVTEKNRLRVNCCGVLDVIAYEPETDISFLQRTDVTLVGVLIAGIALNDANFWPSKNESIDLMQRGYSAELNELVGKLIADADNGCQISLDTIINALGRHSMLNMDAGLCYNDTLESELAKETENGRLVRLLCKFGFINERPEFDHDAAWSETGERYVLKLFRDYVFHQVSETGLPVIDMAHVLSCLNKLDTGSDERLMLISRDEQSCVIVSYKELKICAEAAFQSLRSIGNTKIR